MLEIRAIRSIIGQSSIRSTKDAFTGLIEAPPHPLSWVPASCRQDLPLSDTLLGVKLEKPGRRFAFIGQRLDGSSLKYEVIFPTLKSRVEETYKPAVRGLIAAAMFAADNVVYLVRRIGVVFMKQAILTPIGGAFRDQSPPGLTHITSQAECTVGPAP